MRFVTKFTSLIMLTALLAAPVSAQEGAIAKDDVLAYLEQLISWQRDAVALEPTADTARELIFQDSLRQNSLHVLQSGFKFARVIANQDAEANPEEPLKEGEELTPAQRLKARAAETDARIEQIHTRLAQLDKLISSTRGAAQTQWKAERSNLQDELKLSAAKQELLQNVLGNINAASTGEAKGFLGKVNNLARSIPELNAPAPKDAKEATKAALENAPTTTPSAEPNTRSPTSILSLSSDLFHLTRKQRALKDFQSETIKLETASKGFIRTLRTAMDEATAPATGEEGEVKLTVDEKITQYKKIGTKVLPLGDATLWIGISKRNVEDWQNLLDEQVKTVLRALSLHLLVLAITLAIPLAISSVVKRAINKYVIDPKRQRQAQTARRVVVGLVILFIVLQNFISDFSSFATFAGFLTAGLAVALQSVLLSLVAHFFFYGRYGVRAGDRVTVGGVTGDILQIGVMRFYLRELKKDEVEGFKPTGKVVAFPNAILFQPAAFYKYV